MIRLWMLRPLMPPLKTQNNIFELYTKSRFLSRSGFFVFAILTYHYLCPMRYWLLKSEPSVYPWSQLIKDKRTFWDGVRNYQARNFLRDMKTDDLAFFYHSNEGTEIVGMAKILKEAYQDPTTEETAWVAVDVGPVKKLNQPVPLDNIKKEPKLANMVLVKNSRLSVQPVTEEEFHIILNMSGTSL